MAGRQRLRTVSAPKRYPASVWGVGGARDSSQGHETVPDARVDRQERELQLEVDRKDHQEAEGVRSRGKSRHRFFPPTARNLWT